MKKKRILAAVLAVVLLVALTGCASIGSFFSKLRGQLFGNDYDIRQYDNYGNLVFTIHGDGIAMD